MKNIVLIGMPGSGKSTVGVLLAKSAGMGFVDTDLLIQASTGRLLYKIIEEDGIGAFLKQEEASVSGMICDNCVIATGGSVVYSPRAMEHLKSLGTVVYLHVPSDKLTSRLRNIRTRGVVMRPRETLEQLYEERCPLYERYADRTVDASDFPEEVVERLLACL